MALPKTVFVREEQDGDTSYLVADRIMGDLVEAGDAATTIGEYRLVRTAKYRMTVEEV